ncbi:MAG TPA: arylsulfatase [Phycisphaerae bacterium]|nr:arylsulfatase [Phycisphaerae bacterium]HOJ54225.1 arylsulfatase [Phycisphaerae bacterium]HOL26584.1 arylsulfatase [Phycisphaerae bacterium]HPP20318.1 arylsulfatase [Phycisphaerae bacterium]HPU32719.1 arylsulfatase [Phycisphaerae bacterium]
MRTSSPLLPLTATLVCLILSAPTYAASRPNILLLMADQMRGDCLGVDGNSVIRTPHLDRLATEGARFRCAYSSTPSCTPARAALLTGLSPWRHGMLGYHRVAPKYPREMQQMLRDAGYYTMAVGKLHYSPQRNLHGFHFALLDESRRAESPDFRSDYRSWFYSMAPTLDPDATGIGFNDYRAGAYKLPEELHPTRWTGDVAVRFLKEYRGSEPFFLMVSFARPHSPYDPPERFLKVYADAEVPPAAIGDWAGRHDVQVDPQDNAPWHGNLGPDIVRAARRAYYGNISFIDEQIGRILAVLAKRGLLENTLILFTSDHGDMLGDHHLWRKTYAYEGSARIPLLVRWPASLAATRDAPRGQVRAEPVELRDILPTFLEAAGIAEPEAQARESAPFDGRSLLNLLHGKAGGTSHGEAGVSPAWRPYIDLEHSQSYRGSGWWNALTDGQWKYILHAHTGQEQLFDLQNDPHELTDLAPHPAHRETLETWRHRLERHLGERGEPYVKDGRLQMKRQNILLSPNYPQDASQPPAATTRPAGRRAKAG